MKEAFYIQMLVEQFIEETNYKLEKSIKKEIDPGDIFDVKEGKIINYGSINDIINGNY